MIYTPFDQELEEINTLEYLPWIGESFADTRVQIVGDSHYDDGDDWLPNNKYATRQLINNNGLNSDQPKFSKAPFLRVIERMICNRQISVNERAAFWKRVSFMNLCQRLLPSIKERPTDQDFDTGWKTYLQVARIVKPTIFIKLAIDGTGRLGYYLNNNETSWERNVKEFYQRPYTINLKNGDYGFKMLVINHPTGSRGFDEKAWTKTIHNTFPQLAGLFAENILKR